MNIQLYLADKLVDLTESIVFPLNKSFENLENPTNILVEYSKSINIPMTQNNNKILGNIYRIDRSILGHNNNNLGIYLDPTKKIPFRLVHNGDLVMEGYAKYVSATNSVKNKYYTLNLFGKLGDIFQELLKVVANRDRLQGLDEKYLIKEDEYLTKYDQSSAILNRNFVNNNWLSTNKCWDIYRENPSYSVHDILGFAPAHRGYYNEFEPTQIQTGGNTITEISEYLKTKWRSTLIRQGKTVAAADALVDRLGASDIVGDGFKDYQMNEFRSYMMKPYIYFNQLFRIFYNKCKTLTGYDMVLDRDWFNVNNPYWCKICYMFDYLDQSPKTINSDISHKILDNAIEYNVSSDVADDGAKQCGIIMEPMLLDGTVSDPSNGAIIKSFKLNFGCWMTYSSEKHYALGNMRILPETEYSITITAYNRNTGDELAEYRFWTNQSGGDSTTSNLNTSDNYLEMINDPEGGPLVRPVERNTTAYNNYYVNIPQLAISGDLNGGIELNIAVNAINNTGYTGRYYEGAGLYVWTYRTHSGRQYLTIERPIRYGSYSSDPDIDIKFFVGVDDIYEIKNWKTNTPVNLANLYKSDKPLFDIIMQYTKMFGLCWDVDYGKKEIKLLTRKNLFKDYSIENWDNKLDKSKDLKIEPITFSDRYIVFNYEDTDGYIYKTYKDKYGVNFGEKKLNTGYDFNTNEKDLFEGISPSSSSSKTYIKFNQWEDWDTNSIVNPSVEQRVLMDCEDADEAGTISINNWYLRGGNTEDWDVIITDDTPLMYNNNTFCYIEKNYARSVGLFNSPGGVPIFSNVVKFPNYVFWDNKNTYSLNFNTPSEDYTYNQLVNTVGGNNIYDRFWKNYIDERYNVQNKKVTAYMYISPIDYNNFKFNKFIILDNQLFMINKIFDYNLNSNDSTKVELIQINAPSMYTNETYPEIAANYNTFHIKASSDPSSIYYRNKDYISINTYVFGIPYVDDYEITGDLINYADEYGIDDRTANELYFYSYFYDLSGQYITGKIKFRNNIGGEYVIDVILDYREWI